MTNTTVAGTSADGPTYELMDVTPELAKEWLNRNTHNRNLRQRVVNGYAADMAAGEWFEDGQSIKFSSEGVLLDGQHRLAAIAQCGVTVRLLVVTGLPDSTQDTMDTGAKRTLADVLKLHGEHNYVTLAAVVLRANQWNKGYRRAVAVGNETRPTHRQLLQTLEEHPELRRSAEIAVRVRNTVQAPAGPLALCHWLFLHLDQSDCAFFFARLGDGVGLMDDDAVYALRRTLALNSKNNVRLTESHLTALLIKSWNAFRDGRPVHLLQFRPGGANPEKFPEPK